MTGSGVDRFNNISYLIEDNFNITPSNIEIWRGDIPYKEGDTFPTEALRKRADEYLTCRELYRNRFEGILDNVFSWSDYMTNPVTNFPNLAICADLPDWYTATEAWVSIFGKAPEIDTVIDTDSSDFKDINSRLKLLSSILKNSDFAETWHDIVRCAQIVYGNKVVRVSKTNNGGVRIDNLALKCWQPFVNEDNTSSIECNLFYNIYNDYEDHVDKCEFIAYVEDGRIIKKTFRYFGGNGVGRLGGQIGETEEGRAFEDKDESPIVVFRGSSIDGNIFGESQFKYWDASIASAIRNYEAIGVLVEQAKEIIRKIPAGATKTDEFTGVTYQNRTGAIAYTDLENPPDIAYVKVQVQLDQVISAYKESIARIARDTGLPASFFDTRELNVAASGTALKTSMYRTELMSNKIATNLQFQIKKLISKIALACDIDIDNNSWDVVINQGLLIDKKEQLDIIQARTGNAVTMDIAQAIKEYEGVSIEVASRKAAKLKGEVVEEDGNNDMSLNNGTGDNTTSDNIEFTSSENNENIETPVTEYPMGITPL